MRLAPARLRRRDPLQWQAELVLKHEVLLQPRLLVGGERHDDGALGAQLDVDPGRLWKLRRKRWPARLARAPERHQRLLARLRLAAGGEHAGGRMRGARPGATAVKHLDHGAAGGQPPGNAKPDDAGANDGNLGLRAVAISSVR